VCKLFHNYPLIVEQETTRAAFDCVERNKNSITVDLKSNRGRQLIHAQFKFAMFFSKPSGAKAGETFWPGL
jgi:crotonobetainyl-CoA:carnitine CoA-transferase CaiB-like acyl-CoA transferase